MDQSVSVSRRAFLRGRITAANATPDRSDKCLPIVGEACIARHNIVCRTCGDLCETGAIRFRPRLGGVSLPELDPSLCTGCADCAGACPASAIAMNPIPQEPA